MLVCTTYSREQILNVLLQNMGQIHIFFAQVRHCIYATYKAMNNRKYLITGEDICHVDQFITVTEKEIVNETSSLWKAIASMVTWYYIVDIIYPPECANTLLFIEKVLLNLPMSSKMQNSSLQIISAIDHLDTSNL